MAFVYPGIGRETSSRRRKNVLVESGVARILHLSQRHSDTGSEREEEPASTGAGSGELALLNAQHRQLWESAKMATHFYCAADCDPLGRKGFCSMKLSLGRRSGSVSKQCDLLHKPSAGVSPTVFGAETSALRRSPKPF